MKVDLIILQLGIIFLPGLLWAYADLKYAAKEKPSDAEFLIRAFLFGVIVYAVEFGIFNIMQHHFRLANLSSSSTKEMLTLPVIREIMWGIPLSLALALLWLYVANYKLITRLLQKVKATKKYGDEDVWDFMFNSSEAQVEYVHVRDLEHQFVYAGWVNLFSESGKGRELLLHDVTVSNFEGLELYTVPRLYLARAVDDVLIEFPYSGPREGDADDNEELPDPTSSAGSDGRLRPREAFDGGLRREGRRDGSVEDHATPGSASANEADGIIFGDTSSVRRQEAERSRSLIRSFAIGALAGIGSGMLVDRVRRRRPPR